MAEGGARVIAIGNALRADDGAGAAVLRRLSGRVPADVALVEAAGEPAALLEAWEGLERVVIVDAVRGAGAPGTVHRFDAARAPLPARTGGASTHGLGLAEALELGRALGRLPARVVVVGIEAGAEGQGAGLSPEVEAALDEAAEEVLAGLGPGGGAGSGDA